MNKVHRVLDDGKVQLAGVFGSEKTIVEAARVSYGNEASDAFKDTDPLIEKDKKLLRYLISHGHTSPFEMVEVAFFVRVPMDCWRQWIRHRTANVNEYSTRYKEAINSMYKALEWRCQSTTNKQGSKGLVSPDWADHPNIELRPDGPGVNQVVFSELPNTSVPTEYTGSVSEYLTYREQQFHKFARQIYEERLQFGVAKELARKDLPLSNYTEAWWKCDMNNLLKFFRLRTDPHAQWEIRQYAETLFEITSEHFPNVCEYFNDHIRVTEGG